ncbi:hypothetical protein FUA23_17145 [Neolewinella aurantiaca]|uniref:Uncharacterized protein n=1 Tax=Neolewinella aurantiaca TaxID=2602767 RepID=A0A5C7FR43_9BACT|nr:hypothetical protein [Neolewinella aurantiaca]TXF87884.1 hypothetical protein FUA23_17145 [Neolewinella aurantiaca]
MIKTIIKIGLVIVAGLLGYNYFFGDAAEQAQSREIVGKAKDLGKDAWELLKSERTKLQEGKYDGALEKLEGLYVSLKDRAGELADSDALDRITELTERRDELEKALKDAGGELSSEGKRKLDDLTAETEELMNEMETKDTPH